MVKLAGHTTRIKEMEALITDHLPAVLQGIRRVNAAKVQENVHL